MFTGFGNFFSFIHVIALAAAVLWAFSFEPLVHYYSPVFHDRDLNADIPTGEPEEELKIANGGEEEVPHSVAYTYGAH